MRLLIALACSVLLSGSPIVLRAQAAPAKAPSAAPDSAQAGAIRVFVDCESMGCDFDFFRVELQWANFVRDRKVSDVLLLVTALRTGSGGREYTVAALGQGRFDGRADTVVVVSAPNDADDTIRRQLTRTFSLMLAPYAAKTSIAPRLSLSYAAATAQNTAPAAVKDRWNFWVFRTSLNGFSSGEKQQSFTNAYLNTSANRVTKDLKLSLNLNTSYNQNHFDLGDGSVFNNIQRNYGSNMLVAKSINGHVTAGATVDASFSDFNNYDLNLRVAPAVEWNLFDYKEFTRRQLTVYYAIGVAAMRYQDSTIYNRLAETRPVHNATVSWNARQPWGSVNMSVFGSQYLHNLSYNSYGVGGFVDLRIAKGLAFNIGGNYSRVNDQLSLRRGQLSDNQVIARQQQLATNFRYFFNFGLSYTFGSIFNSVVNPRFGGGGGGGQMMMMSF